MSYYNSKISLYAQRTYPLLGNLNHNISKFIAKRVYFRRAFNYLMDSWNRALLMM